MLSVTVRTASYSTTGAGFVGVTLKDVAGSSAESGSSTVVEESNAGSGVSLFTTTSGLSWVSTVVAVSCGVELLELELLETLPEDAEELVAGGDSDTIGAGICAPDDDFEYCA